VSFQRTAAPRSLEQAAGDVGELPAFIRMSILGS
jgi:hypothetical protein